MNSKILEKLLKYEIKKMIKEVADAQDAPSALGQDSSDVNHKQDIRQLFSQIPSSPFQGNIDALSNVQLSNESRLALKNWARFANFALKKYGHPKNWPAKVNQISNTLSDKFEFQLGTKNPNGATPTI